MAFSISHTPIRIDKISQPYKKKRHRGIDLVDKRGTKAPIYATADGTVSASGRGSWDKSYGNMVAIYHGHGTYTNHAHMSRRCVRQGQKVKAGQIIGYQGSTGNSTGNHLHYEIHLGKKWNRVNPKPYLDSLKRPTYKIGKTYTLTESMNVRKGGGTNYDKVTTKSNGSKIVVKDVKKKSNGEVWLKIDGSGWICGYSQRKVYVK